MPEPLNTTHSIEEIDAMLAEGMDDLRNSRVYTAQEVREYLREKAEY